ncbi:DUF2306 domain-containing protein [Marinobacterium jannaschii]|uniref:DUF2306 domain-containing protein n=1 Tax=Marinobacterium jannaschii TaxID=64970 RepID=UPI000481013F|nr:DUF2306 domain-containing protein [Marinobacterium jannaschii]
MTYLQLAYLHLATVLPAFVLGPLLLLSRKGTPGHRLAGKAYILCMLLTAVISLLMPAQVGPQWLGHFGFIHIFSVSVLLFIPLALIAIVQGKIRLHQRIMFSNYVGGLLIAGGFALAPGRLLNQWLFN